MPFPGRSDDFPCIGMGGMPAEDSFTLLGRGDEYSGVAAAARFFSDFEVDARHFFGGVDDITDREAIFTAQIEIGAASTFKKVLHGEYMSISEVYDVDVVTDAGAIRGRIVRAIDRDMVAHALCCFQDEGDQVRLGVVVFPDRTVQLSAGRIEVAERNIAKAIGIGKVFHHVFDDQFRAAIDIGRIVREIFFNRLFSGSP